MSEDVSQAAIPEEEYRKGVTTNQFLDAATEAQRAVVNGDGWVRTHTDENGTTVHTRPKADSWASAYSPGARASQVVQELSEDPDSGIDVNAAAKVNRLRNEADQVNKAHDIVTSEGRDLEPQNSEERIQRKLAGNNSIGGSWEGGQNLGSMARGSGRKYDIKDDVAMRGASDLRPDPHGNLAGVSLSGKDGEYVPFAPHHQQAAAKAIKSLGEKQLRRQNEQQRQEEVKAAKEVLGRAGVKIPKPTTEPEQPTA